MDNGDALNACGVVAPKIVDKRWKGHHREVLESRDPQMQADEPIRFAIGERFQQNAIDEREHRGVGADPERKREDRDQGKSGTVRQWS